MVAVSSVGDDRDDSTDASGESVVLVVIVKGGAGGEGQCWSKKKYIIYLFSNN